MQRDPVLTGPALTWKASPGHGEGCAGGLLGVRPPLCRADAPLSPDARLAEAPGTCQDAALSCGTVLVCSGLVVPQTGQHGRLGLHLRWLEAEAGCPLSPDPSRTSRQHSSEGTGPVGTHVTVAPMQPGGGAAHGSPGRHNGDPAGQVPRVWPIGARASGRRLEKRRLEGSGPPDRRGASQARAAVGTRAPDLEAGCIVNPKERKEQVPVPRRGPSARSLPGVRTWSRLPRGDLGGVRRRCLQNGHPWAPAAALLLRRQPDSVPGIPRTPSALTV